MPHSAHPPVFALHTRQGALLTLRSTDHEHLAHVFVLETDIIRVLVLPGATLNQPHSWAIAPGQSDVASGGRDRFDLRGFALPDYQIRHLPGQLVVETSQLRLTITLAGLRCEWQSRIDQTWYSVAADRTAQAINWGGWDHRVYHYLQHAEDQMYFGLGERSGPANRAGQRYRLSNCDADGYHASSSDPLYKHIPFYLAWQRHSPAAVGLFYDTLADCTFDMGREVDARYGRFRSFVADHGDLDYYVIGGATPLHIVQRYTWLTGRPALMPRWALGFNSSATCYADAADAETRCDDFMRGCQQHDMLCDALQLTPGYSSIGRKPHVFHWNAKRFPDPAALMRSGLARGIRVVASITPYLYADHPRYAEAATLGLLIKGLDGKPDLQALRDGAGAWLDFSNPATDRWWQAGIKNALLSVGVSALAHEADAFDIRNVDAVAHHHGKRGIAMETRPLFPLLMAQSSRKALLAQAPNQRPLLSGRAGYAGMQRYVQTDSGASVASWETLQFNIKMGLGLALSGVSNIGHAVGGVLGPKPGRELLLRAIQANLFMPRFFIRSGHSDDHDGPSSEPWRFIGSAAQIRMLLRLRYRLLPQIYHLLWRAHYAYEPAIRPTFLNFPADPVCREENDDWMLGADLLIAPVVQAGASTREVYLPAGCDWFDGYRGDYYRGGQYANFVATPEDPPVLLVRAGAMIALNTAEQQFDQRADARGFALYPPPGSGEFASSCFDDDGISPLLRPDGAGHLWQLHLLSSADALSLTLTPPDQHRAQDFVTLYLPEQEQRPLRAPGWHVASVQSATASRCLLLTRDGALH